MLIPLATIIKKYNLRITGVIHCGAHHAEEHDDYTSAGIKKIVYIEASPLTFKILSGKNFESGVLLFNVACADYEGYAELYAEEANKGQSSSLLQPGTHLKHYPDITFDKKEKVKVIRLDSLELTGYNFMNIDVQGAEGMVLRGGEKTLKGVDYVYTEVNTEDVYKGATQLHEMDALLKDFNRVETYLTRQGWGDAFYIRKNIA
jgi:FkbM family methyltransferase